METLIFQRFYELLCLYSNFNDAGHILLVHVSLYVCYIQTYFQI